MWSKPRATPQRHERLVIMASVVDPVPASPGPHDSFTGREREVLSHIAAGRTYAATAHRLGLSPHTVDTYVRRIRAKSGICNRTELILLAVRVGCTELLDESMPAPHRSDRSTRK